ncbi:MAG: helix-turn-helix domain-containing protein [Planctomycetota bacterium]
MRKCNDRLAALRQRREALLPQIIQLAMEGHSHKEIAAKIGVNRSTIHNWLQQQRQGRISLAGQDIAVMIADIVERYELIYREALNAWRSSRREKPVEPRDDSDTADDSKKKRSIQGEGRAGNAAFLGKAMAALKAIREIRGLDAPRQTQISGLGGGPVLLAASDELSDEQLLQIALRNNAGDGGEQTPSTPPCPPELIALHNLHQAGLPYQLAPCGPGLDAGPCRGVPVPPVDGLHAAPARQE